MFHYHADGVRGQVRLSMLVCHGEWHLRQLLAPLLFDEENPETDVYTSVVVPAEVSEPAKRKARKTAMTMAGPYGFRTLMKDLASINRIQQPPRLDDARP